HGSEVGVRRAVLIPAIDGALAGASLLSGSHIIALELDTADPYALGASGPAAILARGDGILSTELGHDLRCSIKGRDNARLTDNSAFTEPVWRGKISLVDISTVRPVGSLPAFLRRQPFLEFLVARFHRGRATRSQGVLERL